MRSHARLHTGQVDRRQVRPAFTLLELVIAISIMSILAGAATGVVMFSARHTAQAADDDQKSLQARDILDEIAAEVALALNFTETQADAVSFTVPDRSGDGIAESIRYEWVHDDPDPENWRLTRQYNGGDPKIIAEDVRCFDLSYLFKTVSLSQE